MGRVAELAAHFKIPGIICVNKYDLNIRETQLVEGKATEMNLDVLGRIPFDPVFTKAMVQGQTIFEYNAKSATGKVVQDIWKKVTDELGM